MTELAQVAEVEVSAKAKRQRRSATEKLRILKAADACTKVGELGALLRREGIYSSSLSSWRRARDLGELNAGALYSVWLMAPSGMPAIFLAQDFIAPYQR